ncbi:MAG: hypothetical protein JOZ01_05360, partial [Candidatus Eremiobacteraeota bacterium]|nr:hypothetical protein [Candidatus Eremiobacteraeota bacterium]
MNRWFTVISLACIAGALLVRPLSTPGPLLRDFEAYWSAGSVWSAHVSPYGRALWRAEREIPAVNASRDELLPFAGPPATLMVWSALARFDYATAAALWFGILAAAGVALVAVVVFWSLREPVSVWQLLPALALAFAFGPVTSDIALGQVALIAFLGATVTTAPLPLGIRSVAAFAALFQPNVAFGIVSQLGRNAATLALVIGALASYGIGAIFLGWRWPASYAQFLLAHQTAERLSAIQFTPAAIAHGAGVPGTAAGAIAVATALVAILAAVAISNRLAEPFARFAAVAPLAPFIAGFFHEHDFVVAYAAAGWCALRTRGLTRAIAFGATLLVAIDWLGLAQRPTGVWQSALLASAAACAFVALRNENDARLTLVAAVGVAIVFVVCAGLAIGQPAPVWPDALGRFHAPATASSSHVWLLEQARSGLLVVNPVWAFLRELPLAG